jgi:hypothetical protein
MDVDEKMEKIKYVHAYLDGTEAQDEILDKITQRAVNEVFEEVCEEHNVCYVCGKDLVPNVRLMVREPYPQVTCREIFTKGCPDTSCEYNKRLVAKYEN